MSLELCFERLKLEQKGVDDMCDHGLIKRF